MRSLPSHTPPPSLCLSPPRYNYSADFYSYGMVMIWMFEGHADTRRYYLRTQANKHTTLPDAGRDMVDGLLVSNPKRRLGCGATGWDEIKQHPFFEGIDWVGMREKKIPGVSVFSEFHVLQRRIHRFNLGGCFFFCAEERASPRSAVRTRRARVD